MTKLEQNKALIIAYAFPPLPYSGTYRIFRLCKGLAALGVTVHVLTIRIDNNIPNDYDLLSEIPKVVAVHRSKLIDPWLKYKSWKKDNKERHGFKVINKIMSFLLRLITMPDHQIFWMPFAVFDAIRIINKNHIKTVIVSSPPNSSLIIGYFLKKIKHIKFIADLRDPIIGNIAQVHLIAPKDLLSKIEKSVLKGIEKLIINHSDIVITNTKTHRKELKSKFPADKFFTIRNSFDNEDYIGLDKNKYGRFTISHLGAIYGLRKADILFKAVKLLEHEMMPDALELQILFVGSNDNGLHQIITKFGVEKYVELRSPVPHRDAIEIMMKSHLLLLIKATGEGSLGQIPAKFFEYLGTKNRILCLGPEKSEVAGIIQELDAGITVEDDVHRVLDILKNSYQEYLQGEISTITHPDMDKYESHVMASRLMELFNQE